MVPVPAHEFHLSCPDGPVQAADGDIHVQATFKTSPAEKDRGRRPDGPIDRRTGGRVVQSPGGLGRVPPSPIGGQRVLSGAKRGRETGSIGPKTGETSSPREHRTRFPRLLDDRKPKKQHTGQKKLKPVTSRTCDSML